MKRSALGKGLEALIPGAGARGDEGNVTELTSPNMIHELPVDKINPSPFQPRFVFDSAKLAELAQSISERGVIQPIVVRATGDSYELIVGERRLRATELLGRNTIPAIIVDSISNEEAMELTLIENIQREDLNPIEEARAYRRLMTECNMAQADVATRVGIDRSSVANFVRLLSLPEKIQDMIAQERLSAGHARALLALGTDSEKIALAEKVIAHELSVRQLEALVYINKSPKKKTQNRQRPVEIVSLEENLKRIFGTKVLIDQRKKGGRILIEYYSNDELDRLLAILGVVENQ
jgi:ParB family chromosome partitioning protein